MDFIIKILIALVLIGSFINLIIMQIDLIQNIKNKNKYDKKIHKDLEELINKF